MNLWDELDCISAELERRGMLTLAEELRSTASAISASPRVILVKPYEEHMAGIVGTVVSKVKDYYKVRFGDSVVTGIHKSFLEEIRR